MKMLNYNLFKKTFFYFKLVIFRFVQIYIYYIWCFKFYPFRLHIYIRFLWLYININMYIYIYIYIYIYNLRHENYLTPSQITTQFYFSITLYIFLSFQTCVLVHRIMYNILSKLYYDIWIYKLL